MPSVFTNRLSIRLVSDHLTGGGSTTSEDGAGEGVLDWVKISWCVKHVGWLHGLLGVAVMMKLIVSQWIIPENSLLSTSK